MFVYKQYDQHVLDKQFNNRLHVPDFADYFSRWKLLSSETEKKLPVVKDLQYGSLQRERLDVFPSPKPHSKTLVFIHGGYWQMLDKSMFSFIANAFSSYGVTVVLITYPMAPEVSIDHIVSSSKKAIKWVYEHISLYSGDPDKIYVTGHSAGGHLAAMLMTTDWKHLKPNLPAIVVKGTCVISGLFNLAPVRLSYLNNVLKLDEESSLCNSPLNFSPINICPLVIAVGGNETTEFNDQSKALYEAWSNKGVDIEFLQLPELNHFSIIETISDKTSVLHKAVMQLMEIE